MPPRSLVVALIALTLVAHTLCAQQPDSTAASGPPPIDSLIVRGNSRLSAVQILGTAGLVVHQSANYRDLQRAIRALFRTGQFDDVAIDQQGDSGKVILLITVKERPLLQKWSVKGAERVSERAVREKVKLVDGHPLDRAAVERARAGIDSVYKSAGYYAARIKTSEIKEPSGQVRVVFDIEEGSRVSISQVSVEGNTHFTDKEIVGHMASRPEGFFWFQRGKYDDQEVDRDTREHLPAWYSDHGYIDFQVLHDTLKVDTASGKAVLSLTVDEGQRYQVGTFDISGNRRFSQEDLNQFYPFTPLPGAKLQPRAFSQSEWDGATEKVRTLYNNNGYIYAQVEPQAIRRTGPDGKPVIDLHWTVREGSPATINKIDIVGNDVTHERVIREAIVLVPGELFNRDRLIRSYQNIANLGFFQQPLATPDVRPTSNGVDVDIVFRVEEKRTGNINFGASLGQGTGVGGFLGLEEPNLFGRGKRGKLQWQFGSNINDFTLSYTDPTIRDSRVSGTVTLFNSRQRYTVGDLGQRRQEGGSLQLGFPFLGSRYTRVFASYGLQRIRFTGGSVDLRTQFQCNNCTRSTIAANLLRDTRIDLPFATAGSMVSVTGETNGGFLGGTGNYRKLEAEGRWYAPLGSLGGNDQLGGGVHLVLGLTAKSGFIFGDAGPFFTELYSMGGTQYGIPLRGYEEFSITPNGFDPNAGGNTAAGTSSFGKSYAAFTVETGARISQSLYVDAFLDAGNVYRTPAQFDPSRLFRGAGFGAALVSPLGPIGVDLGYGFDRVDVFGAPKPGWKLHFKLGNFF